MFNPWESFQFNIDWTALEKSLDQDAWIKDVVAALPPDALKQDFRATAVGRSFDAAKERNKTHYTQGMMMGPEEAGGFFSIVPMEGRKPR